MKNDKKTDQVKPARRASDRAQDAAKTEHFAEPKKKGPWGRLHFGAAGSGGAENEDIPLPRPKRSR